MRFIPFGVPKLEDLGLPNIVADLAHEERGIILVTGATGSGKFTPLGAMLDLVNRSARSGTPRPPGQPSPWRRLVTSSLSTLRALDAAETINRMIDLFPQHEQVQVRSVLAGTLKGITGQRLLRTKDTKGRAVVCEIMVTTGRIRDFIMDPDQTGQIQMAIAEGEYYGIQGFDQALVKLIEENRVTYEEALFQVASHPRDFRLMIQPLGLGTIRR